MTVPSDAMVQGFTYAFTLRIDSTLGGSSEAALEVFKSPEVLLMSKVGERRLFAGLSSSVVCSSPRQMQCEASAVIIFFFFQEEAFLSIYSIPFQAETALRLSREIVPLRFDESTPPH